MNGRLGKVLAAAVVLLVPLAAGATNLEALLVVGDCDGWTADFTIQWRYGVYEADLDYVVELVDTNDNVLETFVWAGPITRDAGDPAFVDYTFMDAWTVIAPAGDYTVRAMFHLYSEYGEDLVDESTLNAESVFFCGTVASERASWSAVKSLYD